MYTQHPILTEKHRIVDIFADLLKKKNWNITWQGSRVRPIWSHVRPNFSRVRLTKIPGRTEHTQVWTYIGFLPIRDSHSRKEKKVSATQKLNKRHSR